MVEIVNDAPVGEKIAAWEPHPGGPVPVPTPGEMAPEGGVVVAEPVPGASPGRAADSAFPGIRRVDY